MVAVSLFGVDIRQDPRQGPDQPQNLYDTGEFDYYLDKVLK